MNKLSLLLLPLFLSLHVALAQENLQTKKIREKNGTSKETFEALVENPAIRHGSYEIKGRFWRGVGQYRMGERAGIWTFYDSQGQADHQYDFDKHIIMHFKPDTVFKEMQVWTGSVFQKQTVDVRPVFFGGNPHMWDIFASNIHYPATAPWAGQSGVVIIEAEINEDGQIINEKVVKSAGTSLDAEALRVIKLLPDDWMPAKVNGQAVRSVVQLPIRFSKR